MEPDRVVRDDDDDGGGGGQQVDEEGEEGELNVLAAAGSDNGDDNDDDDDESDGSSFDSNYTHISCNLRSATDLLESEHMIPLWLKVSIDTPSREVLAAPDGDDVDDIIAVDNHREGWFRRFVAALRTNGKVEELRFVRSTFEAAIDDDDEEGAGDSPGEQDLAALFGEVLPHHSTLAEIRLAQCALNPALLRTFFESVTPARPVALSRLVLHTIPLSVEACAALGNMLRRNVRIGTIVLTSCRMDAEKCRLLSEGVAHNQHLTLLAVADREGTLTVQTDTFADVLNASSAQCDSLLSFAVHAHAWDPEAYRAFLGGLCTNRKIENVLVGRHDGGTFDCPVMLAPIEHLLRWHNYTIRELQLTPEPPEEAMAPINTLLDRNVTIWTAAAALAEHDYRVNPPALWPLVLQRVGTMPALVYLLLRRGNVDQFASCVRGLVTRA
jgi:hypothetical protein